jgi:citrate lyase subunit beta/citryl-CoA lyase
MSVREARSLLFVPGDRPDMYPKAAVTGADAIILDLEDAVAASAKLRARAALGTAPSDVPVVVRVNAAETQWHEDDLDAVCRIGPAAVMLPKSKSAEAVSKVVARLGARLPVIALIECALGLSGARAIARVGGVARLAFGSIDFCADLGCAHTREALLGARGELVVASRLAGIAPPIDGVTADLADPGRTFDDALHAKQLGCGGKLCVHPKQVAEVARAFAPGEAEIEWARRVLAAGDGVVNLHGEMVDPPVRLRAQAVMLAAEAGAGARR